ncbi:Transmembrane and coiled-coil domains-containing protein 3 [Phytophthora pseudosyringae]|uniref:Transmembrane and coiled-coil domains-containing protein 3 n=1 Tax=Phytophthora pseudosyringae TaxID=221518 RepID=A0A8T1W1X5_9STRA|nr:Transmembrane and coiled-coil domains-containing protein 3 [Phytophthora pseudosyringae]
MLRTRRGGTLASISLLLLVFTLSPYAHVVAQIDVLSDRESPVSAALPAPTIAQEATPKSSPNAVAEKPAPSAVPLSLSSLDSSITGSHDAVDAVVSAADVSIDQVEEHLHIVQQLELSVGKSVRDMEAGDQFAKYTQAQIRERQHLREELVVVQRNLKRLALGLNGTLLELEHVEQEEVLQSKKLKEVLDHQEEEEREQKLEKDGIKQVDYETGHLKNTTGLNAEQLKKLEAVEKKADPAVLHYDMELLAQVAVLLGVSAIGGIIATYFNIPPHAGYLLGGALVGPSCLGVVRLYKEVETISLFGSVFLLFGHGAAYSPQQPEDIFRKYFVGGVAYIVSTVLLVAGVAVYIGWTNSFIEGLSIGLGVCFSTTAPLYEHIRENRIQDSSFGRTVTSIIAIQDVLMSFALGTPEWFSVRSVGWIGVAMVRTVVAYAVVVSMTVCLHQYVVPKLLRFLTAMEDVHNAPLVLLGVVSVCLFMALFSEMIGLSLECGAFLAGLAFVHVSGNAKGAFMSIRVMENLFGSMFFACVGMILNPMFLIRNAGEILSMVLLIVGIKTVSMTCVMTFFRISPRKALMAAVGLCQIGELALIFMIKAHASKLVSRRTYLLFVAAISVFLACSSVFNRRIVLARRKSIYRLPSTVRGKPMERHRNSSDVLDLHVDSRQRAGSGSAYMDSGGEEDSFSPSSRMRRQSSKQFGH